MSSFTKDGGAAFPEPERFRGQGAELEPMGYEFGCRQPGMSLRDWFAGQALAGVEPAEEAMSTIERSEWCYEQADAMLAAREVKP